jgi:hypothetical protein
MAKPFWGMHVTYTHHPFSHNKFQNINNGCLVESFFVKETQNQPPRISKNLDFNPINKNLIFTYHDI